MRPLCRSACVTVARWIWTQTLFDSRKLAASLAVCGIRDTDVLAAQHGSSVDGFSMNAHVLIDFLRICSGAQSKTKQLTQTPARELPIVRRPGCHSSSHWTLHCLPPGGV